MKTMVKGVYVNGVLRLETPLPLPDETPVNILIQTEDMDPNDLEKQQVINLLTEAGLIVNFAESIQVGAPLSDERRKELAELFGKRGPLSEIILEERGSR
jgi:hypothetical protein